MAAEQEVVARLVEAVRAGRRITLVLGSGLTAGVIPGVARMLELADEFVAQALQNPDLTAALANLRATAAGSAPDARLYAAYRRAFAEWVSPAEFDLVMQRATLEAYGPAATTWERIGYHRGAQLEDDLDGWHLPAGLAALGSILARLPDRFGHRVLTTDFDPLLEIAVRRAGGQARSRTLNTAGDAGTTGAIDVVHLHGYWRPLAESDERSVLHDPGQPAAHHDRLAELLTGDEVFVVGSSGSDEALAAALAPLAPVWAEHGQGVESNRLFTAVLDALQVPVEPAPPPGKTAGAPAGTPAAPPRPGSSSHRVHRPALEELLGVRPSAEELLRQLDHEFHWRLDYTAGTPLEVLYWPVRLRPPTLIYAVQAIVAAALSARGVEVILCFDDLAAHPHADEWRSRFTREVERWFRLVHGARLPTVDSLRDFCAPGRVAERLQDPELLDRPTHPWAVQLEYYGRERTVFEVVQAAKAFPDVEDAASYDAMIGARIRTTPAERLVSTPAIWAYLQYLLRSVRAEAVLTLGGDDEATMWRQWHDTFPEPVGHLYHPVLINVRQDGEMLRARSFHEMQRHLRNARELDTWDRENHYVHWTVQNAVLLPHYLRGHWPLSVRGRVLDSWPRVRAALADGILANDTLSAVAREVASLLMHDGR